MVNMAKTAQIPDEIHELIRDKQREMKNKYKISVKISDIIAACVADNIKEAERFFDINKIPKSGKNIIDNDDSGKMDA